ncbi:MAG: homoserine kinase, partial [Cytophagales bacterium]|nr:homoserine kinase [Cytophagales bacterium]
GDQIRIRKTNTPGIVLRNETAFTAMPLDPAANTAGVALQAMLDHLGSHDGFEITFLHKIKPGSGIGSSAASSAAAVYGANYLLDEPLSRGQLVPFAMEGERLASGTAHADNVAPALLGGFVLVRSYHPLDLISITAPPRLFCSIVHPQIELKTEDARKVLKKQISLKDAVVQWGNVAGLIAGLLREDYGLIGRSLQDVIVEPIRSLLIPGYDRIKEAAQAAGALGCSISGSGPSLFALSTDEADARRIATAMITTCVDCGMESESYVSSVNGQGAVILP